MGFKLSSLVISTDYTGMINTDCTGMINTDYTGMIMTTTAP